MKALPPVLIAACVALAFTNCERHKTLSQRAEDAADQAKAQTDPSSHAAIDEAKRIAIETGRPVDVKVTQRVDVSPQPEVVAPIPPPPPPPGAVIIETDRPARSPGQAVDEALQKAGRKLQELGERIEDKADR